MIYDMVEIAFRFMSKKRLRISLLWNTLFSSKLEVTLLKNTTAQNFWYDL